MSKNQIYILPVTLFEVVSHFRLDEQQSILKSILTKIKQIETRYSYKINIISRIKRDNYFSFKTDQTNKRWNCILKDYNYVCKIKKTIVSRKILSEALMIVNFSYSLVFSYIMIFYGDEQQHYNEYEIFSRVVLSNQKGLFNDFTRYAVRKLENIYYKTKDEKKKSGQIFHDVLNYISYILLLDFDYICNMLSKNPAINFFALDSIFKNDKEIENRYKNKFKNLVSKKDFPKIVQCFVFDMRCKGYSDTQIVYFEQFLSGFFKIGKRGEKNNCEDFWLLRFSNAFANTCVLTFDEGMVKSIYKTNARNYKLIRQFFINQDQLDEEMKKIIKQIK